MRLGGQLAGIIARIREGKSLNVAPAKESITCTIIEV